jgi:hypothetical protein
MIPVKSQGSDAPYTQKEKDFLADFDGLALGDDADEEEYPLAYLRLPGFIGKLRVLKHPSVQRYNGERCSLLNIDEANVCLVRLKTHAVEMQVTPDQLTCVKDFSYDGTVSQETWKKTIVSPINTNKKQAGAPEARSSVEVALHKLCNQIQTKFGTRDPGALTEAFFEVVEPFQVNGALNQDSVNLACHKMGLDITQNEIRLVWNTIDRNLDDHMQKEELIKIFELDEAHRCRKNSLVYRATVLQRRSRVNFKSDYMEALKRLSEQLRAKLRLLKEKRGECSPMIIIALL